MPAIDIFFIVLTAIMVIHGFIKGFIRELFSWAALVLSIWVAVLLFSAGGEYIRSKLMEDVRVVPELLAFIAIFLLIMIAVKLLERILRDVVEGANLGAINKFLGAIFGLIEGLALTALILFLLSTQPLFDASALIDESIFLEYMAPFFRILPTLGDDIINTAVLFWPSWKGLSV